MPDPEVVTAFPHEVEHVEHVFVPMADGVRLAARLWLPRSPRPVPAVLESIPYRKRDGTRLRDEPMHRWFAGHGYAAVRVDVRGSGDSEGVLTDEYSEAEREDTLAVIAWLAAQPWCDGNVAMIGKSWGGFAALQAAARRPPALRCVIAVCASDDRYADDAHWFGGCLLNENLTWGTMLMALGALPPDPECVGRQWRALWRQRIAAIRPFPAVWMRHPTRDAYWRAGSIAEDFAAVQVPVLAVSGWADGYSNAVPRLLAGLGERCHALLGPWAHFYPHEGVPGPAIGFLQHAVRFFDRWLRGQQDAFADEPPLRYWLQASERPAPGWPERRGRWLTTPSWPPSGTRTQTFALAPDRLLPAGGEHVPEGPPLVYTGRADVGDAAGAWCAFGLDGDEPGDQRTDDAASLCFDSAPLPAELALVGAARLSLRLAVDAPAALVCVRLCEVFPDGTSARVAFTVLDLRHRHGHERPAPMPVDSPQQVEFVLGDVAHAFAAGNRLRLCLSTSYWPMVWPTARPVQLTVFPGGSELHLPVLAEVPDDSPPPFGPPRAAPQPPFSDVHAGGVTRSVARDERTGEVCHSSELDLEADGQPSRLRLHDIDVETGHGIRETWCLTGDDPASARAEVLHRLVQVRPSGTARVELRATLAADADAFTFAAELAVHHDDTLVAQRRWQEHVPRGE